MDPHFFFVPAYSPLHDANEVERLLARLAEPLARAGGVAASAEESPLDLPLVHVVLTGGTERLVLARLQERARRAGREPVVLVAHPGQNSLPACLEILARVRSDGGTGRIVLCEGNDEIDEVDEVDAGRLREAAHLAGVAIALRHARLGAVGEPSEWLIASSHDAATVRASWGPEVVALPIEELTGRFAAIAAEPAAARSLLDGARASEVGEAEVLVASGVWRVLADLVTAHRLSALAVRCFDLVAGSERPRTTGCLALSRLADDGVPAGCEGDVPSAIALLWLRLLTGAAAWMANPSRISPERGEILLAHCTVPRSLVGAYDVRSHFESGLGVAIGGEIGRGPVTLVRIGGKRLDRIWLAEGEVVASPREASLCRTQALVRTAPGPLEQLLADPLGNHVVLIPGHRAALLRASRELILGG